MRKRRDFTEIIVPEHEKLAILAKSRLCRGMGEADVKFILPFFQSYSVGEDSMIYEEGDVEAFLCLIVAGTVKITKLGGGKVISTLGEGETVGEMTIVDEMPRSASASAASQAIVYAITRNSLNEIAKTSITIWSRLVFNIAMCLSLRLRQANELLDKTL